MDYDKRTPLHVAAAEGAYSVVHWLVVEEGADVNPLDRHHKTPLEVRAGGGGGGLVGGLWVGGGWGGRGACGHTGPHRVAPA